MICTALSYLEIWTKSRTIPSISSEISLSILVSFSNNNEKRICNGFHCTQNLQKQKQKMYQNEIKASCTVQIMVMIHILHRKNCKIEVKIAKKNMSKIF